MANDASKKGFGSDFTKNLIALLTLIVALVAVGLGVVGYKQQARKQKVEATLEYIKRLQDDRFTSAIWTLQQFTICFERDEGQGLSYRYFDKVNSEGERKKSEAVAQKWWDYVENDDKLSYCAPKDQPRKRLELEQELFVVYGRLEALASCAVKQLCNLDLVIEDLNESRCKTVGYAQEKLLERTLFERTQENQSLVESFDWSTVLSVSNYLLLGHRASMQWDAQSGNFPLLVRRLERYMECSGDLEQRRPSLRRIRRVAG